MRTRSPLDVPRGEEMIQMSMSMNHRLNAQAQLSHPGHDPVSVAARIKDVAPSGFRVPHDGTVAL